MPVCLSVCLSVCPCTLPYTHTNQICVQLFRFCSSFFFTPLTNDRAHLHTGFAPRCGWSKVAHNAEKHSSLVIWWCHEENQVPMPIWVMLFDVMWMCFFLEQTVVQPQHILWSDYPPPLMHVTPWSHQPRYIMTTDVAAFTKHDTSHWHGPHMSHTSSMGLSLLHSIYAMRHSSHAACYSHANLSALMAHGT